MRRKLHILIEESPYKNGCVMSLVLQSPTSAIRRKLFLSREDYQTCHIQIQDTQERLAAIAIGPQFYSFFKTLTNRDKALDVVGRLYDNGNDAVITQTPKAYVIWILEPEAARTK
jgi:hypothetical protein